ncbi:MAG: DUF4159 domain-containing protein [Vicinamibacterales bacterium]
MRRLLIIALVALATVVAAQDFDDGNVLLPARYPTKDTFGHGFNFCRALYKSASRPREVGGMGWATDYPAADRNFSVRFAEMTLARVTRILARDGTRRDPEFVVIQVSSDNLFQCPYLHTEDVGWAELTIDEVKNLRAYLLKGGFIWVDDFWG